MDTLENQETQHMQMVLGLTKPGNAILATLTPEKVNLLHGVIGLVGEAGELLDAVKKHIIYDQPLDRANVIEELGDIDFYEKIIYAAMGITRSMVMRENTAKLTLRYGGHTYSDEGAKARADKQ